MGGVSARGLRVSFYWDVLEGGRAIERWCDRATVKRRGATERVVNGHAIPLSRCGGWVGGMPLKTSPWCAWPIRCQGSVAAGWVKGKVRESRESRTNAGTVWNGERGTGTGNRDEGTGNGAGWELRTGFENWGLRRAPAPAAAKVGVCRWHDWSLPWPPD